MARPVDTIRRKITLYIEGSPEEVSMFQEAMEEIFVPGDWPEPLLVFGRPGDPMREMQTKRVIAKTERLTKAWVVVSQPFIEEVTPDEYYPSGMTEEWRRMARDTDDGTED